VSTINVNAKEIILKIVYYGPGLCGKTTSLQAIHRGIAQDKRPEMVSVATEEDRTLFFDFLPIDIAKMGAYVIRLQLYTVPGQVFYNSTRKLVLQGADGVVFVADSQVGMRTANKESIQNLEDNLAEWGQRLEDLPHVLQYNKRDLPDVLPVEDLQADLNRCNVPQFLTVASKGEGIEAPLQEITRLVVQKMKKGPSDKRRVDTSVPPRPARRPRSAAAPRTGRPPTAERAGSGEHHAVSSLIEESLREAAESRFTFATLWADPMERTEAERIEQLIASGKYSEAVVMSAQLVNITARHGGYCDDEARFAWFQGVSGNRYRRFRTLVKRAMVGQTLTENEALFVLHFAAMLALPC